MTPPPPTPREAALYGLLVVALVLLALLSSHVAS
jgi:hypothetical protein